MKGLSPRNLKYMRAFAAAWPERSIVQEPLARIPWYHHIALMEKCRTPAERLWYARQSAEQGWSQMNLYLSAADDLLRHSDDKPTIGLLLCRAKNRIVAEYALRDLKKPIGVAEWETRIVKSLPKGLKGSLPSVEEIERELRDAE